MKRTVSLVLAAALVLGSIPAGFAATAGETLKGYGVVAGDTNGNLNEDKTITRAEMMTVLARLLGKFEEASKYSIPSTSKDVPGHWNANVIAFAEKEGWTAGKGNGMFDPQGVVTLQETAAFMLKALGYTITDYAKVVEEATAKGLLKDVVAKELNAPVKRSDVFASALNTLNAPAKDATVKLGEKLGYFKSEALAVGEIKANAANSFQVKFNKAVDPTKVAFTVKREATATTVATTWNTEKTLATLTYASKLPEGNYEVTVNDTTTVDKPVVMATQKVVIEKEKIAKVEVGSETLLRYSEIKGYVPYKIVNQYGEDVTNTTLGRSLNVVQTLGGGANNTVELKRDSGIAIFTYDVAAGNRLRNLPSVVFTLQDTTAGFVFTKTLKVSETANAIAEIKINGIVNEKGEKVDFVWSRTKAYYLDVTVLDTNGQEIKSLDVLKSLDNNVPILQVRASDSTNIQLDNGYVVATDAPGKTNVAAWRLTIQSLKSPDYNTPVTFTAIAPFGTTGKNNATLTTTLKRAAKVEKFTMLAPAEIATPNRDVEFFFEAFNQNGERVTDYDDLYDRITFSPEGRVKFVKQADGSAKLIGNFLTKQLYYVTATVKGSLTGSFSQVAVDVKEASNDARIQAFAHTMLYTQGAEFKVASDKFVIKDKYDRPLNLKTDVEAMNYYVKVTTSDPNVVSIDGNQTANVYGGDEIKFIGGSKYGTSIVTYELFKEGDAKALSTSSAVVYNIENKDVKKLVLEPSADPTYMTSKDTTGRFFSNNANTPLGDEQNRDLKVKGQTKDGADVRLQASLVTYKTTNDGFQPLAKFKANGVFPSTATSATTVASAQYNNGSDVLTATATVNASADKPVAKSVALDFDSKFTRTGVMKYSNKVLTISEDEFNRVFNNFSFYSYNKTTGAKLTNKAPVFFKASSQYGDYIIDKVDVIKGDKNTGTLTVDNSTGNISAAVKSNDLYTVTASSENGMKEVLSIVIEGAAKPLTVTPIETLLVNYENLPLATAKNIDDAIAAKAANTAKTAGTAAKAIEDMTGADATTYKALFLARLEAKSKVIAGYETAINKIAAYATLNTNPVPVIGDFTKVTSAAVAANLTAYNTAVDAKTGVDVDSAQEIAALIAVTNVAAGQVGITGAETAVTNYEALVNAMAPAPAANTVDAAIADVGGLKALAQTAVDTVVDATAKTAFQTRINNAAALVAAKQNIITLIGSMATANDASILTIANLDALFPGSVALSLPAYKAKVAALDAADLTTATAIKAVIDDVTAPTVASAKMMSNTTFQVVFSEAVRATAGDFTTVMIDVDGAGPTAAAPVTVASVAGSGTTTITVTLSAPIAGYAAATTGTVNVGAGVIDLHGNAITPVVASPIAVQ